MSDHNTQSFYRPGDIDAMALRENQRLLDEREKELNARTCRLDQWAAEVMSTAATEQAHAELDARETALEAREQHLAGEQERLGLAFAASLQLDNLHDRRRQAEQCRRWLAGVGACGHALAVGVIWFSGQHAWAELVQVVGAFGWLWLWWRGGGSDAMATRLGGGDGDTAHALAGGTDCGALR